jgi:hypothetical protein
MSKQQESILSEMKAFYQHLLEMSCWVAAACCGLVGNMLTGLFFSLLVFLENTVPIWHWILAMTFLGVTVVIFIYVLNLFSYCGYDVHISLDGDILAFGEPADMSQQYCHLDIYQRAIQILWVSIVYDIITKCLKDYSQSRGSHFDWNITPEYVHDSLHVDVRLWNRRSILAILGGLLCPKNTYRNMRSWQLGLLYDMDRKLQEIPKIQSKKLSQSDLDQFVTNNMPVLQNEPLTVEQSTPPTY